DAKGDELESEIIKTVFAKVNVKMEKLPEGLAMEWRDGFWVAMNYASNDVEVPSNLNAKFLVGQKKLKTCDVAIWTDN
ncbi:MAG: Beta-galactosidase C-terminal domain, partial [Chitinophagaceae bacterium]|nr:Beta-galactosidase C-terminal domain [Chitinophagaceae bacterium]